jgi:hypothetical protein
MQKVSANPLKTSIVFSQGLEIGKIEYKHGELAFWVLDLKTDVEHEVSCDGVLGFRVLDERDLMEYWPVCSTPNGWLFEIVRGGWVSQELERPGSCLTGMFADAREFLVGGINECVSIISYSVPKIKIGKL